jgi:GNAT superfamily N-acetyltransferase
MNAGADLAVARAGPQDAALLTEIARSAKAHWGYPGDWLRRWEGSLTVTPAYIRGNPTFRAARGARVVGFCAVVLRGGEAVLDHLWVLPREMGRGAGRALFAAAEDAARSGGAAVLRIESDPNAEGFYLRMGATRRGLAPATMDGRERHLPLLEKRLQEGCSPAAPGVNDRGRQSP